MKEFEKIVRSQKRRQLIIRGAIRMLIPASIGGLVLGLTISENLNETFRIFFFSGIIVIMIGFVVSIDRILVYFNLKQIPFLLVQLIKLIIYTLVMLIVFIAYFRLKDNHFIFSKGQFHIFLPVLIYSWVIGFVFTIIFSFSRMIGYDVIQKYHCRENNIDHQS